MELAPISESEPALQLLTLLEWPGGENGPILPGLFVQFRASSRLMAEEVSPVSDGSDEF